MLFPFPITMKSVLELCGLLFASLDCPEVNLNHEFTMPNPTFAIRAEKRLFLGMNRPASLDFQGMDFQNGL